MSINTRDGLMLTLTNAVSSLCGRTGHDDQRSLGFATVA